MLLLCEFLKTAMATPEEAQETQDITPEFNCDEWALSLELSRKITQILRQEELVSKEALSLLELKDLKKNSISPWGLQRSYYMTLQNG